MLNGQLKPAYNVQIALENYFIIHSHVSNDRTDYNTLIPVLKKHQGAFEHVPEEVTADSGYCSEKNLLYLRNNQISSYIKQQEGYVQTFEVYEGEDEQWESLKEEDHARIQSDKGILNRQIRSIQTEGHFGDIKENEDSEDSIIVLLKRCTKNSCCM